MKPMATRYGATVPITVNIDDASATSVSFIVGKEGQPAEITKTASFANGVADLTLSATETRLPLGVYKYQVVVNSAGGVVQKYPEPIGFNTELPDFEVLEALDETEVTS